MHARSIPLGIGTGNRDVRMDRGMDWKLGRADVRKIIVNLLNTRDSRMARNQLRNYLLAFAPPRNRRVMKKKRKRRKKRRKRKKKERREGGKKKASFASFHVGEECNQRFYPLSTCLVRGQTRSRIIFPSPPPQVLYIIDNRTLIGLSIMGPIDAIDRVSSFRHGGL